MGKVRTRSVVIATGILVVGLAPFGVAATGDVLREGQRNGTTSQETKIVGDIDASSGNTGGYTTRQSNKSDSGGGAFYGCRSTSGGTATAPKEPCLRANNLSSGLAFEFNASSGDTVGAITTGSGGDAKKPFTTNATGVATGLNADRVDGADASGLRTRWLLLNEQGVIEDQSGGFTIIDAYATNANVYIDAGSSLVGKGLVSSIAIQNRVDQNADGTVDPGFGGEVSVTRCQIANVVECAPPASKTVNALVVSPRNSDGTATVAGARKRVYVMVSE